MNRKHSLENSVSHDARRFFNPYGTVRVVEPMTSSLFAEIAAVPNAAPSPMPAKEMGAIEGVEDDQVSRSGTSRIKPSLNVPKARREAINDFSVLVEKLEGRSASTLDCHSDAWFSLGVGKCNTGSILLVFADEHA